MNLSKYIALILVSAFFYVFVPTELLFTVFFIFGLLYASIIEKPLKSLAIIMVIGIILGTIIKIYLIPYT